jgi:glycosyltransferase involved in cell wall biosynthesis
LKYSQYILKRKIEDIFIYPFILFGRMIAGLRPLKKEYEIFFFFPFYHTGGAEKVHAMIAQAVGNKNCLIYFTRKSGDKNFLKDFIDSGCDIVDISQYTDNKLLYFFNLIFRGIVSGYVNAQKQRAIVFNGQCNFGYKLSRWVNKAIPQVELIHSFNTFSWIRIPFLPFISKTIMISQVRIGDHLRQYSDLGIPDFYKSKIQFILNGIPLPLASIPKDFSGALTVLYVGRGTEEKRVYLIAKIAEQSAIKKLPVNFVFMGDVASAIPSELRRYCTFLGHKSDNEEIDKLYQQSHIVIITSYTEGFPMVIEEGMARSCAVIATPVGDISIHIKNKENGFLFSVVTDEKQIIEEAIQYLTLLANDRQLLKNIGANNKQYAFQHFGIETFRNNYRQLIKQIRGKLN